MPPVQITVGQLVQLALGTPKMTKFNLSLLHTVLNFLMKKLHCEDDKIITEGVIWKILNDRLKTSFGSVIPIINNNIDILTPNLKLMNDVEECLEKIECKLDYHLVGSLYTNKEVVEGLHTTDDQKNEIAISLLRNEQFIKILCRTLTAPTVQRLNALGEKIHTLGSEFYSFAYRINENYAEAKMFPSVTEKFQELKDLITKNQQLFITAMTELHWILDTKVDMTLIAPFKTEFLASLKIIDEEINGMMLGKAAGVIVRNKNFINSTDTTEEAETGSDANIVDLQNILPQVKQNALLKETVKGGCGEAKEDDIVFLEGSDKTIYRNR